MFDLQEAAQDTDCRLDHGSMYFTCTGNNSSCDSPSQFHSHRYERCQNLFMEELRQAEITVVANNYIIAYLRLYDSGTHLCLLFTH